MRARLFLLRELVKRDFQSRYAGSLMGILWPFLQPLWQLGLFTFVFSTVMKITPVGERTEHFGIFLFAGLIPWMAVQEGVTRSATAITENANLVKNIQFPPAILPLAAVLGGLLQSALAALIFVPILALTGHLELGGLPLLLLALPLQVFLTLGLGLMICCLHTVFRDTAQILSMGMMGWFYFTPVVYPMALVPEEIQPWLECNPLTPLVRLYRQAFLSGELNPGPGLLLLTLTSLAFFSLGLLAFRRLGDGLVDDV